MEQVHQLAKEFFGKFSYRGVLAILFVTGSFLFLFLLLYKKIPTENASAVNVAMGFVLGTLGAVAQYYFGASKDKSDNDKAANVSSIIQAGVVAEAPVVPFNTPQGA